VRDDHPDQQLGRTGHGHFLCFGFRVSASFFFSTVIRSSLDVRVWMFLVNVGTGSLLNCHSSAPKKCLSACSRPRRMPQSCPKRALAGTSEACSASSTTSHSQPGMISFQPRRHAVDEARRAAVRRVADWVEQALPEEERHTTHVMVNQVECREDGCPPMECVIALLRKPKIIFRVRPRHACIVMRCCPRPCTTVIHAAPLTQRSLISGYVVLWLAQFFKPVDEVTQDEALTGLRDTLLAERRLGTGRREHHGHGHTDAPIKHDADEQRATTAMQSYEFEPIGTSTSSCTSTSMRTSTTMRDVVPTM